MANQKVFNDYTVNAVWNKAIIVPGHNHSEWRQDFTGAWIQRSKYGNRDSSFGWEIDHIKPVIRYGSDDLSNLRPLQWENNASKCDDYPVWISLVSSNGTNYIKKRQHWRES
ncbi:MAG: HNH endonuclease [Alphaproteobacteria bacterium]|nr:HNH endonuclease [Alphaproteobacteria bacterium]MBN2675261.1 HNH endonuclease [Alphaproteobacteria bacterium]